MKLKFTLETEAQLSNLETISSPSLTETDTATGKVLSESEFQAMLKELYRQTRRVPSQVPLWLTAAVFGGITGAGMMLLMHALPKTPLLLAFPVLFLIEILYYLYKVVPNHLKRKGRREILNRIEGTQDVRFIAPLVNLWLGGTHTNYLLIYEVVQTLIGILPALNAENGGALPVKQRKQLYRALGLTGINLTSVQERMYGDLFTDCVIKVIEALARIGDTAALPIMRSLLKLKGDSDWHLRVREAVQKNLIQLELIAKEETSAKTLLRASTFEDRTGETLLRPTETANVEAPETLLRPSTSEHEDNP